MDTVEALFTSGIISMAADACRILSIMAVIAVKNTGLALILLLVLPLFAVFTRHVQKRMLAAQLDNRRAVAAVSGQVPETLHNIRTIHALGLEDYMERRYDRRIGESYAAVERTNFYDAVYSPVVLLLNAAVVGVVMLLSASGKAEILALFGMSVGASVTVIHYISRIFTPIESLGMEIQTIQSAMAGVKRIDAFLAQPERAIPEERESAMRGDIVLSHVTFGYGEKSVLTDFSMTVKQGEQVTLIGRTGAGKSTVFKLLLGLYPPESGSITIGGIVLDDRTKTVTVEGEPVSLTPTEYAILHLLMANPGKVFSTKVLYESVWQEAALGSEGAVAVHIRHLREKIEINPSEPRYLKVVWGQGYKMEGGK